MEGTYGEVFAPLLPKNMVPGSEKAVASIIGKFNIGSRKMNYKMFRTYLFIFSARSLDSTVKISA